MRFVSNSRIAAAQATSATSAGKRKHARAASWSTSSRKDALRPSCARPCPAQPAPRTAAGAQLGSVGLSTTSPTKVSALPATSPTHSDANRGPATTAAAAGTLRATCVAPATRAPTPSERRKALVWKRGSLPSLSLSSPSSPEDLCLVSSDFASALASVSPALPAAPVPCRDSVEKRATPTQAAGSTRREAASAPAAPVICQGPPGCTGE
mmetsp:Transcript_1767/g.5687  ORF Transcript_1767/g.5687 Transcript_1767/m.5687 type:complete len:210 (+) Transcript_1767:307-936(+)